MRKISYVLVPLIGLFAGCAGQQNDTGAIDREALVERNNPQVSAIDSLSSLSVGNGEFAFTVDVTGLQTFPESYKTGVPLGTQSHWGWHSFANPENYKFEETLKDYDFGRGHTEPYATQFNEAGRQQDASNWYRVNPHRLHLGNIGLELTDKAGNEAAPSDISQINQQLDLWNGAVESRFVFDSADVRVRTFCQPDKDVIASKISSDLIPAGNLAIKLRFPYPTGQHSDDASHWNAQDMHSTKIIEKGDNYAIIERRLDSTVYYLHLQWDGKASLKEKQANYLVLSPLDKDFAFSCSFTQRMPSEALLSAQQIADASSAYWQSFWKRGGAVDFSGCKDPRAKELERRVVLSQYLMAIQCAGSVPPQETGLTYNSWFGKFHLEMHWWHAVHFALWGRPDLLERSLDWYAKAYPVAKQIAERQGFEGVRWMKMTDPSAIEAPSKVGSFLIWQQPHFIYMAEMVYRDKQDQAIVDKYKDLVFATAEFMADFAQYDSINRRYVLKGAIPAQETLRAGETTNPPFELSYWHYALSTAQKWKERAGLPRVAHWDEIIDKLSVLAQKNGLYLAAETAAETYEDVRFTSDHMAVLGALGIMPASRLVDPAIMKNTLDWVWDNWNWDHTWGWDYPMTAMCAARMGEPDMALGALFMDKKKNTYLINGHNYQDARLRVYLPGNGGLLTTVAMMCAGWDGSSGDAPGFPKDGNWDVKWEGLKPMP